MQIILAFLIGVVSALVGRPLIALVLWRVQQTRGDRMAWTSKERKQMLIAYERDGR